MKKLVMILSVALLVSACSTNASPAEGITPVNSDSVTESPATDFDLETGLKPVAEPTQPVPVEVQSEPSDEGLSSQEIADLRYMREEEKLARDVYLQLFESWGMPVFQNIAGSEETHMEAVLTLLDHYGLQDPATDLSAGEFNDPTLQTLYTDLVAQGERSLEDALAVGALIEEMDIQDLVEVLERSVPMDIIQVYQRLLSGSSNHLRAFTTSLAAQTGEAYVPQYLDPETYQAVLEAAGGRNGPGGVGGMRGSGPAGGERRGWGGNRS